MTLSNTGFASFASSSALIEYLADLLIHEATFGEEEKERAKETGHSTAKEAAQVALAAKARRLVLSHVSARYSISAEELVKEAKPVFDNVTVAKDGMTVEVPFAD